MAMVLRHQFHEGPRNSEIPQLSHRDHNTQDQPQPVPVVSQVMKINRIRNDAHGSANERHTRAYAHVPIELRAPHSRNSPCKGGKSNPKLLSKWIPRRDDSSPIEVIRPSSRS